MKDTNLVFLCGHISGKMVYGHAVNGKRYVSFDVHTSDTYEKDLGSTSMERDWMEQTIRVMCFDEATVNYLQRVGATSNMRVNIVGFLSRRLVDVRGKMMDSLCVVTRDIRVIVTDVIVNAAKQRGIDNNIYTAVVSNGVVVDEYISEENKQ